MAVLCHLVQLEQALDLPTGFGGGKEKRRKTVWVVCGCLEACVSGGHGLVAHLAVLDLSLNLIILRVFPIINNSKIL